MTTNDDAAVLAAARERRFTAELAAVLDADVAAAAFGDVSAAERSWFAGRDGSRDARRSWFAAAVVLLGLAVTVLTALSTKRGTTALQQPQIHEPPQLPPLVGVSNATQLAALAPDVRNVGMFCNEQNRDFAPFARLPELVAADVNGPGFDGEWAADCFAPFATLPKLEVLGVPLQPRMTADHLRVLAKSRSLRSLTLHLRRALTADDVQALATLPLLSTLTLVDGSVDAACVHALSGLPRLWSLGLRAVEADEPTLEGLRDLHMLRALRLERMKTTPLLERGGNVGVGTGLTPAVAAALRSLPVFESLEIEECDVSAAAIAELPTTLRSLSLTRSAVDAGVYDAMQRLVRLSQLGLDEPSTVVAQQVPAAAQVSMTFVDVLPSQERLLRALPLVRLDYTGTMSSGIRSTLALLPSLREVRLHRAEIDDLRAVAAIPKLERLVLSQSAKDLADLDCLKSARFLRRLDLRWSTLPKEAVERALPGVAVSVSPN